MLEYQVWSEKRRGCIRVKRIVVTYTHMHTEISEEYTIALIMHIATCLFFILLQILFYINIFTVKPIF